MASSGLWTPNRDLDPLWKEVPLDLLCTLFLEVQMVALPLRVVSYLTHMRYAPTGNPRVHGMIHHTSTTSGRRVSRGSQVGSPVVDGLTKRYHHFGPLNGPSLDTSEQVVCRYEMVWDLYPLYTL